MAISPRGNSWLVTHGSGAARKRLTFKTYEEAEATDKWLTEEAAYKAKYHAEAAQKGDPKKTLRDAFDRAYREKWKDTKGLRTTLLNAQQMMALLGPDTPLIEIDADRIDKALDKLEDGDDDREGNSPATLNRKLAALSVMLGIARAKGWLVHVPHIQRRKESSGRQHHFSFEESKAMVEAAHHLGLPTLADFIVFALDTGMRRSEMLRLKVEDCRDGTIRLHDGETKNNSGRIIPATGYVSLIISKAAARGYKRVFEELTEAILRGQWDAMRDYLGKADDPKYIVHVLRHTCATRLAVAGCSAPKLMAFMGHKAIQTSMRYIHLHGHHLGDVADLLKWDHIVPGLLREKDPAAEMAQRILRIRKELKS